MNWTLLDNVLFYVSWNHLASRYMINLVCSEQRKRVLTWFFSVYSYTLTQCLSSFNFSKLNFCDWKCSLGDWNECTGEFGMRTWFLFLPMAYWHDHSLVVWFGSSQRFKHFLRDCKSIFRHHTIYYIALSFNIHCFCIHIQRLKLFSG